MQIVVRNHNEQHHIHHNLFRNIPPGNGNGYETLQLITEGNPFDPPGGHSQTLIENNLFIRCNGEAEIISIKSNGNTIRRNNFRACKGGLVLRHGDDNLVTGNFFFGDGETGSGGVRLQGTGQEVAHNYFHELGQYGIAMMDGTPDDLYMRVERAEIVFNTFIRCRKDLVIGLNHSKHPNGTAPKDCRIVGNIFYESLNGSQEPFIEFVQGDEPVRWDWVDNLAFKKGDPPVIDGIRITDPHLKFKRKQLAIPSRRTLVVDILDQGKVTKDRSGNQLNGIKTTGAIQFPAKSWKKVLLTEQMVGPDAMEY
jgi:poly(beta-D-mannuronate) lyase